MTAELGKPIIQYMIGYFFFLMPIYSDKNFAAFPTYPVVLPFKCTSLNLSRFQFDLIIMHHEITISGSGKH